MDWDGTWGSGFRGQRAVMDAADIAAVLAMRDPEGYAEFQLGRVSEKYPCLSLHVAGERWYIYFFPEEETEPGAFVVGDTPGAEGETRMAAGSDIYVSNDALVGGEIALRLANEFMMTGERPTGVEWFEL